MAEKILSTSRPQEISTLKQNRLMTETMLIAFVSLMGMWFVPTMKTLFALIPVIYLIIERRLRQRAWYELGFSIHTFWGDLKTNWVLFILLGFIIQPGIVLWAKTGFPEYLAHIQMRLPFESGVQWGVLLPLLAFSLLGEEMTYRSFLQGRLSAALGIPAAITASSILFGLAHFAPGNPLAVITDISLIMVSSCLYGTMFARRANIWPVWLAHLVGDIFGLLALAYT